MSFGIIIFCLILVDLGTLFVLIYNAASKLPIPFSTIPVTILINVVGVMAIRALKKD
jgi:hypothetical protein